MGLWSKILDLIYPPNNYCYHCGQELLFSEVEGLCYHCLARINYYSSQEVEKNYSSSQSKSPFYQLCVSVAQYQGLMRELILDFKYRQKKELKKPLGQLLALYYWEYLAEKNLDLIIPVPLHWKREAARGYNQVKLLGQVLAAETKLPLVLGFLLRVKETPPLYTLGLRERIRVLTDCFQVKSFGLLKGKKVLLLDDIITTGSTINEASRVLKEEGLAREVAVLTLARA